MLTISAQERLSTLFTSDEQASPLTVLLHEASLQVMAHLLATLGSSFPGITAAQLTFFGALDCGSTHASGVATRLGISRQAVSRTARELQDQGLLILQPEAGRMNQNLLVMTEKGEALARAGRAALAEIESRLGLQNAKILRDVLADLIAKTPSI
jgi:DNA-binding MarR family transcriptional regulator